MPRFDGTGPMGQGPMTGRGCGRCVPNNSQDERRKVLEEEKLRIEQEIAKIEKDAQTETLS